jgi:sugar phosphate permease
VILGVTWIAYAVVFLNRLGAGPLAPFFKGELGLTNAQVGLVMGVSAFGYTLTQIPAGWFVDRTGARWPIALGEFIAGAGMLGVSVTPSYGWLLSLMLLTGMGCGFLMPATAQAIVVWFPRRERATVMGLKQTAVNLGGVLATLLPAIAVAYGWRAGFKLIGLVAIGIGVCTLFLYREPPMAGVTDSSHGPAERQVPLRELLTDSEIWLVALAGLFMNWVEMAMLGHFVLYMKDALLFSVVAAGGMLAAAVTAGAIARPLSGLVSDWLFAGKRKPVFLILALMATATSAVLALSPGTLGWMLYPLVLMLGVGAIGFGGIFVTMLSEFGGRRGAGTAAAFGSTVSMIGSVIGPIAFGYVVDITRSYRVAWLSQAVVGALGAVALIAVRETKRDM